ncbi:MAG TPA: ABC transporter ATP-binding protein [Flavisolibacter sp.]
MQETLLQIKDLTIDFRAEGTTTTAVRHVSLTVNRGEIVALVGESGSGKSVTSLSILGLLPRPPAEYSSGSILFYEEGAEEVDLLTLDQKSLQRIRGNKISMIFQEPMTSLNPVMTCGRQVAEVVQHHKGLSGAAAKKEVLHWFEKVQLPNPAATYNRYPHQLSGGQKQRVMIAMAMCCEPSLLICDEPTTALDVTVQQTVLKLIRSLQQERQMGVIFITHDLGVVAEIADRVAIMYRGEIVEEGETERVFKRAGHPYTRALIACRPANHPRGARLPVVADFMQGDGGKQAREEHHLKENLSRTQSSSDVLVDVQNLSVRFTVASNWLGKPTATFTAVDDVSFALYEGETLGLVGESGCGKTTLGRTLLRLVDPSSGKIIYKNRDITALSQLEVKDLRRNVQLVFQDPYSSLNPRLTVGAAIAEPMALSGIVRTAKERRARVAALLDQVNLPSAAAGRYPHEFSGGQRQRIVIARALALDPTLLVCDESVSALDVSVQAQVLNLLNELKRNLGLTMLFISHDLSVVRYMSDRIAVMERGKIIELGGAEEVYRNPREAYTQKLLAAIPRF